jgi:putative NADH-flavin reductase
VSGEILNIVVFGANGPTGLEVCHQALAAGHHVTAAVRRPKEFPIQDKALTVLQAQVMDGSSLLPVIGNADAVLSTLGAPYSRHEIRLYSVATKAIVEAMRSSDHCRRLVVVSAGLVESGANTPNARGFFLDYIIMPFLRNVIGRTLYEDMLRMEDFLTTCDDIAWTVIRPARLIHGQGVSEYRLVEDFPAGNFTTRSDLAAVMLAELDSNGHVHKKIAPSTR